MSTLFAKAGSAKPGHLPLQTQSLGASAFVVVLGSLVLAASAQISVPMWPVPMTLQSLAIVLIGALCGWRLAGATVLAYLAEAFVGLPFLAGGAGGPAPFVGPTAGYLMAFPVAAMLVGWLAEKGLTRNIFSAFGTMIAGHAVIFMGGVAWLAAVIGAEAAVAAGVVPFMVGMLVKSGLAASVVRGLDRR